MSAVVLIRCSGCFKRYPINPNKHKDRDIRFCPFCRTPQKIKRRKFLPNLKWPEQKLKQQADRVWSKEMRKPKPKEPMPRLTSIPENLLALSLAILRREKEIKEEQSRKSEKPNP